MKSQLIKVSCPACGTISEYDAVTNQAQMRVCNECRNPFYLGAIWVAGQTPQHLGKTMHRLLQTQMADTMKEKLSKINAYFIKPKQQGGNIDD